MSRLRCTAVILLFVHSFSYSQHLHEEVFADLTGSELRDSLVLRYKTDVVLSYGKARDTFMRNIDGAEGELICVYTGYNIRLSPEKDPSQDALRQGINTEHLLPRSKGATPGTIAYSDMHNLFPSREIVNSIRGNVPLGEVDDRDTDAWFWKDSRSSDIPSANIDNYSEVRFNTRFEPRENFKGNAARSLFYFYTMYRSQVDDSYFEEQRPYLCDWHIQDPVDSIEWSRNIGIARYQDDKKNPFVLDCRLARLYCPDISASCVNPTSVADPDPGMLRAYPNPCFDVLHVDALQEGRVYIYDSGGNIIMEDEVNESSKGLDVSGISPGIYLLKFESKEGSVYRKIAKH